MNYVFFDEIQIVKDFPKAINSLCLKKNVDLYVTNSKPICFLHLSARCFSGRFIEMEYIMHFRK
jgi:predicted AAA+ superfamily ATPase